MADFTITIQDSDFREKINSLLSHLKNRIPAFKKMGLFILKEQRKHFTNQEGPKSKQFIPASSIQGWEPLSQKWAERKRKLKRSKKILVFTGDLLQHLISDETNDFVKVGPSGAATKYASRHQFGEGNTPQRSFLWLSKEDMNNVVNILQKHIEGS